MSEIGAHGSVWSCHSTWQVFLILFNLSKRKFMILKQLIEIERKFMNFGRFGFEDLLCKQKHGNWLLKWKTQILKELLSLFFFQSWRSPDLFFLLCSFSAFSVHFSLISSHHQPSSPLNAIYFPSFPRSYLSYFLRYPSSLPCVPLRLLSPTLHL